MLSKILETAKKIFAVLLVTFPVLGVAALLHPVLVGVVLLGILAVFVAALYHFVEGSDPW